MSKRVDNSKVFRDLDLTEWKYPESYMGIDYEGYFVLIGTNRDDDIIGTSNYEAVKKIFEEDHKVPVIEGYEMDKKNHPEVIEVHFNHFLCGHVSQIMIYHKCKEEVVNVVSDIVTSLSDYPVLDDNDYEERKDEVIRESYQGYIEREFISLIKKTLDLYDIDTKEGKNGQWYLDDLIEKGNTEWIIEGNSAHVYNMEKLAGFIKLDKVREYFDIEEMED